MTKPMQPFNLGNIIAQADQIQGQRLNNQINQSRLAQLNAPQVKMGGMMQIPGMEGYYGQQDPSTGKFINITSVDPNAGHYTLGPGQTRRGPNGEVIATGPKRDTRTPQQKNFEYMQAAGYDGTFGDFMKDTKGGIEINNMPEVKIPTGYMANPGYNPVNPVTSENSPIMAIPEGPADASVKRGLDYAKGASKLDQIEGTLERYSALFNESGAILQPGAAKMELGTAYKDLQLELKELFNLGVLNGPDLELIESYITDPTGITGNVQQFLGGKDGFNKQLGLARAKLQDARSALERNFNPSAQTIEPETIDFKSMTNEELEAFINGNQPTN